MALRCFCIWTLHIYIYIYIYIIHSLFFRKCKTKKTKISCCCIIILHKSELTCHYLIIYQNCNQTNVPAKFLGFWLNIPDPHAVLLHISRKRFHNFTLFLPPPPLFLPGQRNAGARGQLHVFKHGLWNSQWCCITCGKHFQIYILIFRHF